MSDDDYMWGVDLARELGCSVGVLLQRADDEIDRQVRIGGLESARGMSTRVNGSGRVLVSEALAAKLRQRWKDNPT